MIAWKLAEMGLIALLLEICSLAVLLSGKKRERASFRPIHLELVLSAMFTLRRYLSKIRIVLAIASCL